MRLFEAIVKMTQPQLKRWLKKRYIDKDFEIVDEPGFLLLKPKHNPAPILLTAHMDTVHEKAVRHILVEKHVGKTILSSSQGIGGDDRCGIYIITKILDEGMKPYVVFCEDEEIGCVGAKKFSKTDHAKDLQDKVKFIVELDRRNATDIVFYDCDNPDFTKYIENVTGYIEAIGSYSDICEIAPKIKVAAVNLSCGYYQEHTLQHYVVWEEMHNTLQVTKKLIKSAKKKTTKTYEYMENEYYGLGKYYGRGYGYGWYDDCEYSTQISYIDPDTREMKYEFVFGVDFEECVGQFLIDHPDLRYNDIMVEMI